MEKRKRRRFKQLECDICHNYIRRDYANGYNDCIRCFECLHTRYKTYKYEYQHLVSYHNNMISLNSNFEEKYKSYWKERLRTTYLDFDK